MKRTRCLVVLMALIMALAMVACGSEQGNNLEENTSSHSNRDDDENEVEVEDPEPDEKPEVTKPEDPEPEVVEPEPEPEPVVEDDPNVIDGIDFSGYNNGQERLYVPVLNMTYDSLRVLVLADDHAVAILKDGESFEMQDEDVYYIYEIFVPKEASEVEYSESVHSGKNNLFTETEDEIAFSKVMPFNFRLLEDTSGENMEYTISVKYVDGTEETITLYITKEFVSENISLF